ncbi:hypothetical protein DFQ11_103212 [Winogradskyella epiphytica]|uniref:Tetratricopeptide repeat protein n=1 Tax=Winogradskyella epiphytica TaxID=262005 RepID=A0A2V4XSS0_9FLAO|nr:hypothetical protein [Winogradskyella epiphytica]PYE81131.1 hypothetical protein DFQ11_103212 [Winogradskyella epiphytica]GGW67057.1 hypothetical protein GCM10008085_18730 [Winogradskyella epiphytica]
MKLKSTISLVLFIVFFSLTSHSQAPLIDCDCERLEETEENDAKVIELAEYIQSSFYELESRGFDEKFDIDAFKCHIAEYQEIDLNDDFTKGFMQGVSNTGSTLSKSIINTIETGAYYNLVNYKYNVEEMTYYFTFRLYSEATGVNYHDYKVCTDGETLKFSDIYIYLTAEHFSSTLRRIFLLAQPKDENSRTIDNSVFNMLEARKFATQGKFEEAYNRLSEIKGPMAKEKFTLLTKASYASSFNDELYEEALKEFSELYPNDPTLYLKQVDYNILKGDFKTARQNVDKLIYETNDDFLNLLKGNIYVLEGDYINAEKHYKYMTSNYIDLIEGYIGYMVSLNFQNRFEEVLEVVKHLIAQEYDKDALLEFIEEKEPDGSNALEGFVNSEVYKNWKRNS